VTLGAHLPGRPPGCVEVMAYYVVSGTLANAARHTGASAIGVADAADHVIRAAVRDDGDGGADPARGSAAIGLENAEARERKRERDRRTMQ
jgi:signal transduction histidine kinase